MPGAQLRCLDEGSGEWQPSHFPEGAEVQPNKHPEKGMGLSSQNSQGADFLSGPSTCSPLPHQDSRAQMCCPGSWEVHLRPWKQIPRLGGFVGFGAAGALRDGSVGGSILSPQGLWTEPTRRHFLSLPSFPLDGVQRVISPHEWPGPMAPAVLWRRLIHQTKATRKVSSLHLPFLFGTRKGLFLAQEKEEKQLLKSWTEIQWDESAKASEFQYPTPTPRKSEWSAFLKENVLKNTQTYKLHRIM